MMVNASHCKLYSKLITQKNPGWLVLLEMTLKIGYSTWVKKEYRNRLEKVVKAAEKKHHVVVECFCRCH